MSDFGQHIMIDGRQCDLARLSDMDHIWHVLDSLPEVIGMTKIIQPYVFPYSGLVPEDKGLTGVVIIAESHITIHTFTEKNFLFCDIFSCRPFDAETAIAYIADAFGISDCEIHQAERGRHFPKMHNRS